MKWHSGDDDLAVIASIYARLSDAERNDFLWDCELIDSQCRAEHDAANERERMGWQRERLVFYLLVIIILALMSDSHHLAQFWQ